MRRPHAPLALAGIATLALLGGACTSKSSGSTGNDITVRSTADACELSATQAKSGTVVFAVTNDGSAVTEFYLLSGDGQRVIGEVENIGPGLTRNLTVQVEPGEYLTACKPGMVGDGIRAVFTVRP